MFPCLSSLAFVFALIITPALARFLSTRNITDEPDGKRKLHNKAVPRLGGVAVLLAFLATVMIGSFAFPLSRWAIRTDILLRLAPGCAVIFLLGVVDDLSSVKPNYKLTIQVFASLMAVVMGIQFGDSTFSPMGFVQVLLTVLWLVLCTNAFNLIDGMDGLATGLGLILSATIALMGYLLNQSDLFFAGLVLAACLCGFLMHNFHPASIFLGDSGSLTIGFLLGCLSVLWSNHETTITGRLAPALAFGIPFADVMFSITRRFLSGRPIFSPDREHLHHRLLQSGLNPRRTALLLYVIAGCSSFMAIACAMLPLSVGIAMILAAFVVALLFLRSLHYSEFHALRLAIASFSPTALIASHLALSNFKEAANKASSRVEFLNAFQRACSDFGFDQVRLTWGGDVYEWKATAIATEERARFSLNIEEVDTLALSGGLVSERNQTAVSAFLEIVLEELKNRGRRPQDTDVFAELPVSRSASFTAR